MISLLKGFVWLVVAVLLAWFLVVVVRDVWRDHREFKALLERERAIADQRNQYARLVAPEDQRGS